MTLFATRVRELENRVRDHIAASAWTAPVPMLAALRRDVQEVHDLAAVSSKVLQDGLNQTFAVLVTLVANAFMRLGDVPRAWLGYDSARRAIDSTDNRMLQACVRAQNALLPMHFGRAGQALDLAREAEQLLTETPCDIAALTYATSASALARCGDPVGAQQALWRAEAVLDRCGAADDSLWFGRKRYLLYASNAWTVLGEREKAQAVQDEALGLYGDEVYGSALIRLDRALGLTGAGNVVAGCRLARTVTQCLPDEHRIAIVLNRAADVLRAVPAAQRECAPAAKLSAAIDAARHCRVRITAAC
jgi:tetratricopeptide (TPR) repeat protein